MTKKLTITIIALIVGALHFVTGENYQGPFPGFVNGYLIDILLPMVLFLLMSLFQNKIIRSPLFRACAVFGFGCFILLDADSKIIRWGHTGEEDGVSCRLLYYPTHKLDVVVLSNQSSWASKVSSDIYELIMETK